MTATEMREALEKLGWSQRDAAFHLEVGPRLVRYWCSADPRYPIPKVVEIALEALVKSRGS